MKIKNANQTLYALSMISIQFLFNACQESMPEEMLSIESESKVLKVDKRNKVKIEDIMKLHGGLNSQTRSSLDIDCIKDATGDTILYIFNKPEGGWTMYSSDARLPAIIAESEDGSFGDVMNNETSMEWILSMASDIKTIKNLQDDELTFSHEEIESNRGFWKSIDDFEISEKSNNSIYSQVLGIDKPLIPEGHYEYSYTSYFTETYDSIPRMISTNWDQNYPYNKYCPLKSKGIGRAPAGCAAIAVAQLFYFLHDKYGVPRKAPSEAYCNGNINSYSWAQYNETEEIWNIMSFNGEAAAPMIADIGRRIGTKYGNKSSSSTVFNILSDAFVPYGLAGKYTDFDEELLKENLQKGLPVLIEAYSVDPDPNNSNLAGHLFIADRYKRSRKKYETHYMWVYDYIPEGQMIPYVPDKVVIGYLSPYISMIGFNWGWEAEYNISSEWYSLTGDWIKNNGETYNWNKGRKMVYVTSINL